MSPPTCLPNSTRAPRPALAAALGLALLAGCALQQARPLERAYADADALARRHPGHGQLEAVQREIASLREAAGATVGVGFALQPAVIEPFGRPEAGGDGSQRRIERAVNAEMRLVERQLRREQERRLALEAERLKAGAQAATAARQGRLDDALDERLREIQRRYRDSETALTLRREQAERRLGLSPLAVGEAAQAELERAAADRELQALRERKEAEVAAARRETRSALETFRAAEEAAAAEALAAAQERGEREIARTLGQRRDALTREMSDAPASAPAVGPAAPLSLGSAEEMPPEPKAVGATIGDRIAGLEALRARVAASLDEQTRAAAVLVGRRHDLEIAFERREGLPARDVTAQLRGWLDEYWQAGAGP